MTWRTLDSAPRDETPIIVWSGGSWPEGCRIDDWGPPHDHSPKHIEWLAAQGKVETWPWWLTHWQPIPADDDPAWQSMETAPKDGTWVLYRAKGEYADIVPYGLMIWADANAVYDEGDEPDWRWMCVEYGEPAAWAPIPADRPPVDEVDRIVLAAYEYVHGYPMMNMQTGEKLTKPPRMKTIALREGEEPAVFLPPGAHEYVEPEVNP